jgi:hypothetical protein
MCIFNPRARRQKFETLSVLTKAIEEENPSLIIKQLTPPSHHPRAEKLCCKQIMMLKEL